MLYKIAHFLRDQMPWLWDLVDIVNSFLFRIRYGETRFCGERDLQQRLF